MELMKIQMDGKLYKIRVKAGSLTESFRIEDGPNADTLITGEEVRDVVGTYYDHRLDFEPDPRFYSDYTAFYEAISAPVDSHEVTFPHGSGTITHRVSVTDGGHTLSGFVAGNRRYTGLSIFFKAIKPDRLPE